MQISIILSDLVPEFGRDDCWLFVFLYSFGSQRWKLAENYFKKCLDFLYCNMWKLLKTIDILDKCYHQFYLNIAAQIAGKEISMFSFFSERKQCKKFTKNIFFSLHEVKFSVRYFEISERKNI